MKTSSWLSMTGYAQHDWNYGTRQFKFQIKSVNHRFFEFRLRAPREWQMMESSMKNWCKSKLERGSIDLWIEESQTTAQSHVDSTENEYLKVNSMFKQLGEALNASRKFNPLGKGWMPDAIRALILSRMPELWFNMATTSPSQSLSFPEENEIQKEIEKVCEKLMFARSSEGEETRKEVDQFVQRIRQIWNQVSLELPSLKSLWQTQLEERLNKLSESFSSHPMDPQRIYQEFVLLADKRDVAEEIQRISSHLKALQGLIDAPQELAIGKKLDFFMQELNREWTTLSNKIQNAEINQFVGEAKMTIEKIREQSLNLV